MWLADIISTASRQKTRCTYSRRRNMGRILRLIRILRGSWGFVWFRGRLLRDTFTPLHPIPIPPNLTKKKKTDPNPNQTKTKRSHCYTTQPTSSPQPAPSSPPTAKRTSGILNGHISPLLDQSRTRSLIRRLGRWVCLYVGIWRFQRRFGS